MGHVEAEQVLNLLSSLVDKSLVVYEEDKHGQGRYRLLETVRQYGRDRLVEGGEAEAVRGRHRDWFIALAEEVEPQLVGPEQGRGYDRLETEHDNLCLALEWAVADPDPEPGVRCAGALVRFWNVRGHLREGRQCLRQVLAASEGLGVSSDALAAGRAKLLNGAGAFANQASEAREFFEEALALYRKLGDNKGIAETLAHLANLAEPVRARGLLAESLALFREAKEDRGTAVALARMAAAEEDPARSQAMLHESLALARHLGDKQLMAWPLNALGYHAHMAGDYAAAHRFCRESLEIRRALNDITGIVWTLENMASLAVTQGQAARAVCLIAAATHLRDAYGFAWTGTDRADVDQDIANARALLDAVTFAAAWDSGQAMTLDGVIRYALEEEEAA